MDTLSQEEIIEKIKVLEEYSEHLKEAISLKMEQKRLSEEENNLNFQFRDNWLRMQISSIYGVSPCDITDIPLLESDEQAEHLCQNVLLNRNVQKEISNDEYVQRLYDLVKRTKIEMSINLFFIPLSKLETDAMLFDNSTITFLNEIADEF